VVQPGGIKGGASAPAVALNVAHFGCHANSLFQLSILLHRHRLRGGTIWRTTGLPRSRPSNWRNRYAKVARNFLTAVLRCPSTDEDGLVSICLFRSTISKKTGFKRGTVMTLTIAPCSREGKKKTPSAGGRWGLWGRCISMGIRPDASAPGLIVRITFGSPDGFRRMALGVDGRAAGGGLRVRRSRPAALLTTRRVIGFAIDSIATACAPYQIEHFPTMGRREVQPQPALIGLVSSFSSFFRWIRLNQSKGRPTAQERSVDDPPRVENRPHGALVAAFCASLTRSQRPAQRACGHLRNALNALPSRLRAAMAK